MNISEKLSYLVESGLIPSLISFSAQLVSTLILFWALKKFVWVKMQEFLQTRREVIIGELESAKAARMEAESLKEEYETELKNAKSEASRIIDNARSQALETKQQIIIDAEKEAAYKLEKAEKEIVLERANVEAELKRQVIDIALTAAEKLVNEKLDENKNRQLIDKFIDEVQ